MSHSGAVVRIEGNNAGGLVMPLMLGVSAIVPIVIAGRIGKKTEGFFLATDTDTAGQSQRVVVTFALALAGLIAVHFLAAARSSTGSIVAWICVVLPLWLVSLAIRSPCG